jgi:hypothetical protein
MIFKHPERLGYMVAPFSYVLDVFLYNLVLHLTLVYHMDLLNITQLEVWSGICPITQPVIIYCIDNNTAIEKAQRIKR